MARWNRYSRRHRAFSAPVSSQSSSQVLDSDFVSEVSRPAFSSSAVVDGLKRTFDSWGDFVDECDRSREHCSNPERCPAHQQATVGDWCSTTRSEAYRLARHGWPEGEEQARRLSSALFDRLSTQIEREFVQYDVEGSEIDVARYLDGEPECWQRFETRITEGVGRRIVRIVVSGFASGGVPESSLIARGSAVAALCELLEHAGHGVEISVNYMVAGMGDGRHSETVVPLKSPDQPLDMSRLVYALAHPTSIRKLYFASMNVMPDGKKFGACNYLGMPPSRPPADQGDVFVDCASYYNRDLQTEKGAREWVIAQLKLQGVVLTEEGQ